MYRGVQKGLGKVDDRNDRIPGWQVYSVGGGLLTAVELFFSFYRESKLCLKAGREEGEYFPGMIGVRRVV